MLESIVDQARTKHWFLKGKRHREDGPAVEYEDGAKEWYLNGKRHRVDGPAVEYEDGAKEWYLNGKRHRVDGPAIEDSDGTVQWWLSSIRYSLVDWCKKLNKSEEETAHLLMIYG